MRTAGRRFKIRYERERTSIPTLATDSVFVIWAGNLGPADLRAEWPADALADTLTRANEPYPERGVPFTAMLTIADPKGERPVFNAMRQSLQALGVQIADVRVAARVVARV